MGDVHVRGFVLWLNIGRRFGRTGLGIAAGLVPILGAWVFASRPGRRRSQSPSTTSHPGGERRSPGL
jgi:hypothetical protein